MQVPVAGVQTPQAVLPPRTQRRKYAGFLGGHLGSNYEKKTRIFIQPYTTRIRLVGSPFGESELEYHYEQQRTGTQGDEHVEISIELSVGPLLMACLLLRKGSSQDGETSQSVNVKISKEAEGEMGEGRQGSGPEQQGVC